MPTGGLVPKEPKNKTRRRTSKKAKRTPFFAAHASALHTPLASGQQDGVRPAQLAAAHALSAHFFARTEQPSS